MNDSIKLGRIAGIPIGVNWTWLFVFALIVWSLAGSVFPSSNPGLTTASYVVMAVSATVLFFESLLLHELGHALVARREGVEIAGITLWLFGGVARMRGMFPSAGAEFRIAVAGPAVTAVLATGFVALALLTHFAPAVDAVFAWLGYINLLLLAFNLLPALPLDGGRIFRAALWRLRGDFRWATSVAATVARVVAVLLVVVGIALVFTVGALSGVWLALIGWFVFDSARGERRLGSLTAVLGGLIVADVMRRDPPAARADQTLASFADRVPPDERLPAYPVLDGERPVGLLPAKRLLRVEAAGAPAARVRYRMLPLGQVPVLRPEEPAAAAAGALAGAPDGAALVLSGGRLAGIVFLADVTAAAPSAVVPLRAREAPAASRPRDVA